MPQMLSSLEHYCWATWVKLRYLISLPFYPLSRVFSYSIGSLLPSKHETQDDIEASPPDVSSSTVLTQDEISRIPTLAHAEAALWNKNMMLKFKAVLEENPAVDLLSMFSDNYQRQHRIAQYAHSTWAAKINLKIMNGLHDALKRDPEVNLQSTIPKDYNSRFTRATGQKDPPPAKKSVPVKKAPDFRSRLDLATTAAVVFPLSEKMVSLLALPHKSTPGGQDYAEQLLLPPLKALLRDSQTLWESPIRGMVVKCNEDIVAKVVFGNEDYTEYTSLAYLAEHMPDVPAPQPHGLIAYGPFRVLFMSYIPGITLTNAWPGLSHEEKLLIQGQLDTVFRRLRTLRQDDGKMLGGVCGEGVAEIRVDECAPIKGITTAAEFDDLQFSVRRHGSSTYFKLLRSFIEHNNSTLTHGSVFTHGDVRTDNIIVKEGTGGGYTVSGIIDWELSGFYPEYYECTGMTRNLSMVDENDWYLYLPKSIAPSQFSIRWLVDHLWEIYLRTT